jgi:hypothetical protein
VSVDDKIDDAVEQEAAFVASRVVRDAEIALLRAEAVQNDAYALWFDRMDAESPVPPRGRRAELLRSAAIARRALADALQDLRGDSA